MNQKYKHIFAVEKTQLNSIEKTYLSDVLDNLQSLLWKMLKILRGDPFPPPSGSSLMDVPPMRC
jgi:hypothetical protein